PTDVQVLIGWTGSPAETDQLVTQATTNGNGLNWTDTFLRPSAANVNSLILALGEEKFPLIHTGIRTARKLLARLASHIGTLIEIPQLCALMQIALLYNCISAKTSVIAGDDSGIVFAEPCVDPVSIYDTWHKHVIQPHKLTVTQLVVAFNE